MSRIVSFCFSTMAASSAVLVWLGNLPLGSSPNNHRLLVPTDPLLVLLSFIGDSFRHDDSLLRMTTLLSNEWTTSSNKSCACGEETESTMGVVVVFEATAFLHSRIIGGMLAVVSLLRVTCCGHQLVAFMNSTI
jgi:hypothetical protein